VGGIVALLNSYRLNNNKSPLGYIVPLVYAAQLADPTTFTDITIGISSPTSPICFYSLISGDNKCTESCCSVGFEATKGWDPVRAPLSLITLPLYCFILFYFILFYFILFYFVLFYFILFYFILFYFILFILYI
jgi:hypothetical protein